MHVKLPPPGLPTAQPEAAPSKQWLSREIAADRAVPATDQADIRPLDVRGGLQVLLAEVRSAFELIAESSVTTPAQAARQIVEWVLQAMPEDASDATVWAGTWVRIENALQAGLQHAEGVLSNWPEAPVAVIDAVKQSSGLVLQALSDEKPNPLWLRPEWLGLVPRLERFRRRRRAARRHLTDPDLWQRNLDEENEQER